ncbi:YqhA family protein [Rubrobacter tropicus]|uniref:YqhA family protein n=1 Tax=Rubrobacter tropicus TaxID=2653851 RepID=A0A6G8Q4F2_9ACTN|nr:YqhA family protein [Rubrobacter tropicus]QIN81345.1 YqhA family protein [Rubrobacter tropicus]
MERRPGLLERFFERVLWDSRLLMLVAVVAGVLLALGTFYLALVDLVYFFGLVLDYGDLGVGAAGRNDLRADVITAIVKVLDGFLISAILIIVSLGLYELFVNRIDVARFSEASPRLLQVHDLDDLKERVARLILLVLLIEFFQRALRIPYETALDLLYLGLGILFVSAAIYLTTRRLPTAGSGKGGDR